MNVTEMRLKDIRPYDKNPRNNDVSVDKVAASIQEFGFQQPIVVDSKMVIIAGHTRYKAAQKLGLDAVPVIVAEGLSEDQVKAYRLADNKAGEESTWNFDLLLDEIQGINDIDMTQFGFSLDEVTTIEEPHEDDCDIQLPKDAKTKIYEVWKLGEHRLMCGDSTDLECVKKLSGGVLSDLWITDPPYNVAYEGKTKNALTIQNDNMKDGEFLPFLVNAFSCAKEVMKPGAGFYIWHSASEAYNFMSACIEAGLQVRQQLIWEKNTFVMGRQDYQWQHEPCLYGWKEGASHYFVDARNLTTIIKEKKPARNALHPTMKPIELIGRQIENSSKVGDIVLDTFGGSGSTLIACEQLKRRCLMMELDPKYCDVIIARWEEYTGQKAELISE